MTKPKKKAAARKATVAKKVATVAAKSKPTNEPANEYLAPPAEQLPKATAYDEGGVPFAHGHAR